MRTHLKQAFFSFIPFAIVITFLSVLIYGVGQQVIRQSADDTQVQMAEDAASLLSAGQMPESVIPEGKIDMEKSLAPFLIIYNGKEQIIASSGTIGGKVPALPSGVLDSAKDGEDHITWQPDPNVRDAIVVVSYAGKQSGYVLAGKSLREIENHESLVKMLVFFAWISCLVVLYVYFLFVSLIREQLHGEKVKRFTIFKNRKM